MRNDSPSDTAVLIAKSLLLLSRDPQRRRLVHPEDSGPLREMIGKAGPGSLFERATRHPMGRWLLFGVERMLLEGIQLHYASRKRWIERKVREALERGVTQVVVVGAGFDLLAWRLSREFPQVAFFELDHPATRKPKHATLDERQNLHLLPLDIPRDRIQAALEHHPSFSPGKSTVCVAEGLLMYLTEAEVSGLLSDLSRLAAVDGAVIFTFMEKDASGNMDFRGQSPLVARWLKKRREPFRWGIARLDLPGFLTTCGLTASELADDTIFREQILEPAGLGSFPLARGECACHSSPSPP